METSLAHYERHYQQAYEQRMLSRLGLAAADAALVSATAKMLQQTQVDYHSFFAELGQHLSPDWQTSEAAIAASLSLPDQPSTRRWAQRYRMALTQETDLEAVSTRLAQHNPQVVPVRPEIEAVWEPIVAEDDWQPFHELIARIRRTG